MSTELSKNLMCVQMRSGVEIWVEADRANSLQDILEKISSSKFIRFDEQTFNSADIVGVFSALTMSDLTRRKNGEWKCQEGEWHEKKDKCDCSKQIIRGFNYYWIDAVQKCGICKNGYLLDEKNNKAKLCECCKELHESWESGDFKRRWNTIKKNISKMVLEEDSYDTYGGVF